MDIHSAKKLLHQRDVEILVVGGGPSGVGAGFAAARLGRKVLIVDQFNCLGGVATAGGHGHMSILCAWADTARVVGGIPYEVSQRITDEGFGRLTPHGVWFEVDALKYLYDRMAKECGAEVLYHTFFCEPIMDGQTVCGAVVQNKTGRCAIFAQRTIDCTGDGDVAAGAGAPFEIGRPSDQRCQPGTLMFTVGGVEWERVEEWRKADRQGKATWKLAQDKGDMDPFQTVIMGFWWTHTRPDQVGINFTHITKLDSTKAEDITSATIEGRRQAFQCINVLYLLINHIYSY
jgi:flavin-dependent dehydrogenase